VNELSSYVFAPLREGDIALYRGSGNGLAPILFVAAEETALDCIEGLEHEYALKGELEANWAARPVALMHYNNRMTLVLEDPGGNAGRSTAWPTTGRITFPSHRDPSRKGAPAGA
jgi:hypothetical protein